MSSVRVAFVAPHPLLPANSGDRVRTAQLVPVLRSLGVDVRVIWADYSGGTPAGGIGAVTARPSSRPGQLAWRTWLAGGRLLDPYAIHRWPPLRRRLAEAVSAVEPDVVDFQHSYCWFPVALPSVLTVHNVDSHRLEREGLARPGAVRRVAAMEAQAVGGSDVAVTLSDLDAQRLSAVAPGGTDIVVVSLGHDPAGPPAVVRERVRTAAFVGSFGYQPNVVAARELVERWPAIREAGGFERLVVVGAGAGAHVRPTLSTIVRSDVADVPAAISDADVLLVPLTSGGGVRVKIIEAMALGLPVVSTLVGIEGLGAIDGVHAAISPDLDSFPDACRRVRPVGVRRSLAAAGRQLWEACYSPRQMGERMLAAYERAIANHTSPRGGPTVRPPSSSTLER